MANQNIKEINKNIKLLLVREGEEDLNSHISLIQEKNPLREIENLKKIDVELAENEEMKTSYVNFLITIV